MELLLIPTFAVLNRWRGSDFPRPWCAFVAKILCGLILGYLLAGGWYGYPLMIFLYLMGESLGWGKWVGSILQKKAQLGIERGIEVYLVHMPANFIVEESKNYLFYSYVALAIRGLIWWLPVAIAFLAAGFSPDNIIAGLIAIIAGFPLSVGLAAAFRSRHGWEIAEIIYGALQGAAVYLWIV